MNAKSVAMRGKAQRFRRRMNGKDKAVSPVVATLILILIAVAAAAALYLWLVAWQGSLTGSIGTTSPQATLTIGGSTSVYPFDQVAVTQYEQNHSDVVISDNQGGSGAGMLAVCAGAVNIGAASFPVDGATLVSSYGCGAQEATDANITTVAYDAVDIIVSSANPHGLNSINYDTLALIYSDGTVSAKGTPTLLTTTEANGTTVPAGIPIVTSLAATTTVSKSNPLLWDEIPACVGGAINCGGTSTLVNPNESTLVAGPSAEPAIPADLPATAAPAAAALVPQAETVTLEFLSTGAATYQNGTLGNITLGGTATGSITVPAAITAVHVAHPTSGYMNVTVGFTYTPTKSGTLTVTAANFQYEPNGSVFPAGFVPNADQTLKNAPAAVSPAIPAGPLQNEVATVTFPAPGFVNGTSVGTLSGVTVGGTSTGTSGGVYTVSGYQVGAHAFAGDVNVTFGFTFTPTSAGTVTITAADLSYTNARIAVSGVGQPCANSAKISDICYVPAGATTQATSPCGFTVCAGGAASGSDQATAPIVTYARSDASGTTQSFEARLLDAESSKSFATAAQLNAPTTGFTGCGSTNYISDCGYVANQTGNGNPGVISGVAGNPNGIGYASDGLARASGSGVGLVAFLGVGQETNYYATADPTWYGGVLPTTGGSGTIALGILGQKSGAPAADYLTGYLGWRPFDLVTLATPTGEAYDFEQFVLDPANNIALAGEAQEVSIYSV